MPHWMTVVAPWVAAYFLVGTMRARLADTATSGDQTKKEESLRLNVSYFRFASSFNFSFQRDDPVDPG